MTPFIWRHGGFETDPVIHTRVSKIDFAPTTYELAGGNTDGKNFDGKSFKAVPEGDTSRVHSSLYFEPGYARAVVKGKYKYLAVRYPGSAGSIPLNQRKGWLGELNESLREHGFEPRIFFGIFPSIN